VLGLGALAASSHARRSAAARPFLFLTLLFVLIAAQIAATPHTIGPHHHFMLWPLSWVLGVLGLLVGSAMRPAVARLAGPAIAFILILTIAGNTTATEAQIDSLRHGKSFAPCWKREIAPLARYVNEQLRQFDAAICVEWGVGPQLFAYCPIAMQPRISDIWFYFDGLERRSLEFQDTLDQTYFAGKRVVAIIAASGAYRPGCRENFFAFVKHRGRQVRVLKAWQRSHDGLLYGVIAVE
jgi:hypothetical protein